MAVCSSMRHDSVWTTFFQRIGYLFLILMTLMNFRIFYGYSFQPPYVERYDHMIGVWATVYLLVLGSITWFFWGKHKKRNDQVVDQKIDDTFEKLSRSKSDLEGTLRSSEDQISTLNDENVLLKSNNDALIEKHHALENSQKSDQDAASADRAVLEWELSDLKKTCVSLTAELTGLKRSININYCPVNEKRDLAAAHQISKNRLRDQETLSRKLEDELAVLKEEHRSQLERSKRLEAEFDRQNENISVRNAELRENFVSKDSLVESQRLLEQKELAIEELQGTNTVLEAKNITLQKQVEDFTLKVEEYSEKMKEFSDSQTVLVKFIMLAQETQASVTHSLARAEKRISLLESQEQSMSLMSDPFEEAGEVISTELAPLAIPPSTKISPKCKDLRDIASAIESLTKGKQLYVEKLCETVGKLEISERARREQLHESEMLRDSCDEYACQLKEACCALETRECEWARVSKRAQGKVDEACRKYNELKVRADRL
eukprot:438866_1